VAAAVVLVAAAVIGGVVATSGGRQATPAARASAVNTATVDRGNLADMVSQYGILTYRAQSDGSPYAVINRAGGTYTELPTAGDKVVCGGVLYRVNNRPVLLLCGSTPAYRSLSEGDRGPDVAELNANLVRLGYATRAQLDPSSRDFSPVTASALTKLQGGRLGEDQTGSLQLGQAVFLPEPVRIAKVTGGLGGPAQLGAQVAQATSETLEVEVNLDPSQQREVKIGDRVQITLPDNTSATGKVERLGRVAQVQTGQDPNAGATVPAYISLGHPQQARSLDQAPVQVAITTRGVENALSVPVTAIVGQSGGGFAVEVVHASDRRELVPVKLGLFDTAGGRVQVIEGDLHEGDQVVMPSS
jgi:hypothetical protein